MNKLKFGKFYIDVHDEMPDGWKIQANATTNPKGYVWITNGLPQFSGKKIYAFLKTDENCRQLKEKYDCIGDF